MNRAQVVLGDDADGLPRLGRNAATGLTKRWKVTPRRERVLEPPDLPGWWAAVEGLRSRDSRLALKVLVLTGLRVSEALGLLWEDVHGRTLRIRDSKTGAFQKVIGPHVAALLAGVRPDGGTGPVFDVKDLRAALEAAEGGRVGVGAAYTIAARVAAAAAVVGAKEQRVPVRGQATALAVVSHEAVFEVRVNELVGGGERPGQLLL
jgi:integrase